MRWKTTLTVLAAVFLLVPLTSARTYTLTGRTFYFKTGSSYIVFPSEILPLQFQSLYRDALSRWNFGDYWIRTTGNMTLTSWFAYQWLNYTVSGGTQEIYCGVKPYTVYFDDVLQTEDVSWSYESGVVTVTPSGTDVAVGFGTKPVAVLGLSKPEAEVGENINFYGANSYDLDGGYLTDYSFTFGDGASISGVIYTRSHSYTEAGVYTATLTVTDDEGQTNSTTRLITVVGPQEGFFLYFPENESLGFQNDIGETVRLEVTSGTWNSTINKITLTSEKGYFQFVANENTSLRLDYTVYGVTVRGDGGHGARTVETGNSIRVAESDTVTLEWSRHFTPWIPFSFILGMVGVCSLFAGPLYAVQKCKEGEYNKGLTTGLAVCTIGVGFFIAWLW